jgi:hypothetical protein
MAKKKKEILPQPTNHGRTIVDMTAVEMALSYLRFISKDDNYFLTLINQEGIHTGYMVSELPDNDLLIRFVPNRAMLELIRLTDGCPTSPHDSAYFIN